MKKLQLFALVTLMLVYGSGLTMVAVAAIGKIFDIEMGAALPIGILIIIPCQAGWGLISGIISYRRGWHFLPGTRRNAATEIFALCFTSGFMSAPIGLYQSFASYQKIGKFFPTPEECPC